MSKKNKLFANILGINNIKMGMNYTKKSLSNLILSRNDTKEETFKEACIRFNIIGTHYVVNPILKAKYIQHKKNFYIKTFFSILVIVLSFYYLFLDSQFLNGLMCLLLSLAIFTFALTDSLHCYHINKRELALAKKWIKNPLNWFPKKFEEKEIDMLEVKKDKGVEV
jgi:hypothetical protein